MVSIEEHLEQAYNRCFEEILQRNKLKDELRKLEESISLTNLCISKHSQSKTLYPIIVGNILTRASITCIEEFPPYKYNEKYIYPLNYTVKKRFGPHRNYKKSMQNKVLYVCTIGHDGITITSDDGYVWKGPKVWKEFCEDVGITDEFKNIEDFMALNHPTIMKLIEEIGDISGFEGYTPLDKRNKRVA